MTIVFYDTETTGTDPDFDQILQFAAIKTDEGLNELDRLEIRCRLQPHVIPALRALEVNRITAETLVDPALPTHYQMVRSIREKLNEWSPALFAGYNSLKFDELFLRQALYQTLHSPYLTNTNGNSRSDVLRMAQAAAVLVPGSITVPVNDEGKPTFRLDRIAPANGFHHRNPHDALSDVEATIHLCGLIASRAPEVWSTFMRFSQKAAAADFITDEPVFCMFEYFGGPQARLVTVIGRNNENSSEYYVFDLANAPEPLGLLPDEELMALMKSSARPVRRLKSNAAPFVMPAEAAPEFTTGKELTGIELERRAQLVRPDTELNRRLITAFESGRPEKAVSAYVEQQIYDDFLDREDEALIERFHSTPWDDRMPLLNQVSDSRTRWLGRRLIYLERPDALDLRLRGACEKALACRLLEKGEVPWLTVASAMAEIDGILRHASPDRVEFLQAHRRYLADCHTRASHFLEAHSASVAAC